MYCVLANWTISLSLFVKLLKIATIKHELSWGKELSSSEPEIETLRNLGTVTAENMTPCSYKLSGSLEILHDNTSCVLLFIWNINLIEIVLVYKVDGAAPQRNCFVTSNSVWRHSEEYPLSFLSVCLSLWYVDTYLPTFGCLPFLSMLYIPSSFIQLLCWLPHNY